MFSGMQVKQEPGGGMFGGLQVNSNVDTSTKAHEEAGQVNAEGTQEGAVGGFNFSSGSTSGGFTFVAPAPAPEPSGFKFVSQDPPAAATGFNFVEQTPSSGVDFSGLSLKVPESKDVDFAGLTLKNQDSNSRRSSNAGELDFAGMTLKTSTVESNPKRPSISAVAPIPETRASEMGDSPLDLTGLTMKSTSAQPTVEPVVVPKAVTPLAVANEVKEVPQATGFSFKSAEPEPSGFSFKSAPVQEPPNQFETVQTEANKVMIKFFDESKALLRAQNATREQEAQLNRTIRDANLRIKANEAAVAEFIAAEEYEKAGSTNALVDQDKALIKQTEAQLEKLSASSEQTGDQLIAQTVTQIESFQGLMAGFSATKQKQMDDYVQTETNRLEELEEGLQLESDRIDRSLQHTKADLDKVEEELQTIEASIQVDTKEVILVKAQQEELKARLDGELAELLRLLAEKKKEVQDNEVALASSNEKLAQARIGHEKKLKRLGETKSRMVEEEQHTLREQEELDSKREALNLAVATKEEKRQEYLQKLKDIESQKANFATFLLRLKNEREKQPKAKIGGHERTVLLQRELAGSLAAVEDLVTTLGEKELGVAEHQKIIMAADLRFPALEAEKAVKITKKDFAGAGALAKDIKDLQAAKTASEDAIKQLKLEIENCKTEQERLRLEQGRLEVAIEESTVTADTETYQKLQIRCYELEGALASLPAKGTPVEEADRSCLELEITFTKAQLGMLRDKHQWSEDSLPFSVPVPSTPKQVVETAQALETKTPAHSEAQSEVPPPAESDIPLDVASAEAPPEEAPSQEVPSVEAPPEEVPSEEVSSEKAPSEEAPPTEVPSEIPSAETPSVAEFPADAPVAETPSAEETPSAAETPSAEESPSAEIPLAAEEVPPAEETPSAVEETPSAETPVETPSVVVETPSAEVPSPSPVETPSAETSSDVAATQVPEVSPQSHVTPESQAEAAPEVSQAVESPLATPNASEAEPETKNEAEASSESAVSVEAEVQEHGDASVVANTAANGEEAAQSGESQGAEEPSLTIHAAPAQSSGGLDLNGLTLKSADPPTRLDFGGLTIKSPAAATSPAEVSSEAPALDFGGLNVRSSAPPLDFGGLTVKPQTETLDFGGLTIKSPNGAPSS